jgi:hypothetical protein
MNIDPEIDPIGAKLAQLAPGTEVAASWAMRPNEVRIKLINGVLCELEQYLGLPLGISLGAKARLDRIRGAVDHGSRRLKRRHYELLRMLRL